jgi:hypothetical protein
LRDESFERKVRDGCAHERRKVLNYREKRAVSAHTRLEGERGSEMLLTDAVTKSQVASDLTSLALSLGWNAKSKSSRVFDDGKSSATQPLLQALVVAAFVFVVDETLE